MRHPRERYNRQSLLLETFAGAVDSRIFTYEKELGCRRCHWVSDPLMNRSVSLRSAAQQLPFERAQQRLEALELPSA